VKTDRRPILTKVLKPGQRYLDEPIEQVIKPRQLVQAVKKALGCPLLPTHRKLIGYRRVELAWKKPNG
jgi:hypothetical protein